MKRHVIDNGVISKIKEEFVDREHAIQSFSSKLSELISKTKTSEIFEDDEIDPVVLSVYGMSGLGKSNLLGRFGKIVAERNPEIPVAEIDFSLCEGKMEVISKLHQVLENKYGFSFPLYDFAYLAYLKNSGQNVVAVEKEAAAKRHPLLRDAIGLAEVFIGPVSQIIGVLKTLSDKNLENKRERMFIADYKRLLKDKAELLERIIGMEPKDILDNIQEYFADDLAEEIEKRHLATVIMFDTYDKYISPIGDGYVSVKDDWIKDIVSSVPGVLWVFAGREKLSWDDDEWEIYITYCKLNKLEKKYIYDYLKDVGITEEAIGDKIRIISEGIPLYLSICCQNYYNLGKQDKNDIARAIEGIGQTKTEMISRYVNYIPDSSKDLFNLIACMGSFNDEIITHIGKDRRVLPSYQISDYDSLKLLSVIRKDSLHGRYVINSTVADTIVDAMNPDTRERFLKHISEIVNDLLEQNTSKTVFYNMYVGILVRVGILMHRDDVDNLYHFFEEEIVSHLDWMIKNSQLDFVEEILRQLVKQKITVGSRFAARIDTYFAEYYIREGSFKEAKRFAKRAGEYFKQDIGEDSAIIISSLNMITNQLVRTGSYKRAYETGRRAYDLLMGINSDDSALYAKTIYGYCDSLFYIGKYDEAKIILNEALIEIKNKRNPEKRDAFWLMNILALMYADTGDFEKALVWQEEILNGRMEILGEDNSDTLWAMHNKANTLDDLGRYEDSLKLRERITEKRIAIQGKNHPDTLWAYQKLAKSHAMMGDPERAICELNDVISLRKAIIGENHPDTWWTKNTLARIYMNQGQYQEAKEILLPLFEFREEKYGLVHPYTLKALGYLALCEEKTGEKDNAEHHMFLLESIRKALMDQRDRDTAEKQKKEDLDENRFSSSNGEGNQPLLETK